MKNLLGHHPRSHTILIPGYDRIAEIIKLLIYNKNDIYEELFINGRRWTNLAILKEVLILRIGHDGV